MSIHPMSTKIIQASVIAMAVTVGTYKALPQEEEETTYELSPFTIDASSDTGYRATSSLAGTRIKTELRDVASGPRQSVCNLFNF